METVKILALIIMGGAAIFYFPIYLLMFIYRSQTWKKRNRPKPSTFVFILYLVSLALVIWAVGIFSSTGIKFPHKAKQSEAKTNLGAIYTAQQAYFARHHVFAGGPDAFKLMGWEPWRPKGKTLYAYACGADFLPNEQGDFIPRQRFNTSTEIRPATSFVRFTCMAVGNIDNDPDLDYWIINDAKVISNTLSSDL